MAANVSHEHPIMSTHVTRCPNCQTSFHVRSDQLLVAEGAVRCGSCLQVFIASDHFVDGDRASKPANTSAGKPASKASKETTTQSKPVAKSKPKAQPKPETNTQPAAKPSAPPKPAKKAAPETPKSLEDDDFDGLIHDDMELDEDDAIDLSDSTPAKPPKNGLLIDDDPFSDLNLSANGESLKRNNTHALSLDLNDDSDFFSSPKDQTDDALFLVSEDEQEEDDVDESWAKLLLEDEHTSEHVSDDTPPSQPKQSTQSQAEAHPTQTKPKLTRTHKRHKPNTQEEDNTEPEDNEQEHDLLSEQMYVQGNWIPNDTPLELGRPKSRALQTVMFTLGALLLMLTLAAQLAYFNISTWSSSPMLRPYYEYACQWVSCDLPAFRDPRQIKSQHLVVRSHPSQEGALVIDALLINQAPFEQPFPNIRMEFQDLQQKTVSSRIFSPTDYLGGELSGRRIMPSQVPIHIAINVIDPGADAVNYTLDVLN